MTLYTFSMIHVSFYFHISSISVPSSVTAVFCHLKNSLLKVKVPFGGASKSEVSSPSLRLAFVRLLSGLSNGWSLK